ncbi:MAG: nitrous oxide reductase accessory protein NosL [Solibacillus sp.]
MKRKVILLFMMVLVLTGCGNANLTAREIQLETDICEICNMAISHPDYAAQAIFNNNDYQVFDDLGCLMDFLKSDSANDVAIAYIFSEDTGQWIDVKEANYVYNADYWTPMNYGVLAFEQEQAMTDYVHENGDGQLLNFEALLTDFKLGVHTH